MLLFPKQFNAKQEILGLKERTDYLLKSINELNLKMSELVKLKEIPQEELILCQKIHSKLNEPISIEQIYKIIGAYKEFNPVKPKNYFDQMKKMYEEKKPEIEKIKNCFKCNKAIKEGEYYLVGDKAACLKHLNKNEKNLITSTYKEIKKQTGDKNEVEENNLL